GAPDRAVSFTVPTGNFGDIFAGHAARLMGLPVDRLVIATNQNDILDRTLKTGRYEVTGVTHTASPSMDIQVSSNFERLLYLVHDGDAAALRRLMAGLSQSGSFTIAEPALTRLREGFASGATSEQETLATIRTLQEETGEVIDPHTAVACAVARRMMTDASPMVTLATAHPAQFPDAVEQATGLRPGLPPRLSGLLAAPERFTVLPNNAAAVKDHILARIGS
ncbi:MAG TPA: threonine synthase, partial [Aestuariivirga sp.]|nr:threonine synthase [Aestuariivirga sp.]